MIKIAPSILSADFAHLARDIRRVADAGADWIHVDVMDGIFVPNLSIGLPVVRSIRAVTDLPLDVHLMIERPVRYAAQFCEAGADMVTVHVEADTEDQIRAALDAIHRGGKRAGVVLKPGTAAEAVLPFIDDVDLVLVMTVEPGFGGQSFMADMVPKIAAVRRILDERRPVRDAEGGSAVSGPESGAAGSGGGCRPSVCELEVDGGVDTVTGRACIDAGATVLVAGSAVYGAEDIPARIAHLRGGRT